MSYIKPTGVVISWLRSWSCWAASACWKLNTVYSYNVMHVTLSLHIRLQCIYAHTCYYCSTDTDEDAYQNYASSNTTNNDPRWHSRLSCRRRERERDVNLYLQHDVSPSLDATPLNWCKNFCIRWTKERGKCSSIVDPQTVIVGSYWHLHNCCM